jgi:hypothetical protein
VLSRPAFPTALALVTSAACAASTVPATGRAPARTPTPAAPQPVVTAPAPATAFAAAHAYIDAFDTAADSGDTAAYDRIVTPGCPCREPFLSSFVASLRAHHWHTNARRVITAAHVVRAIGSGAIVDVAYRVAPYRVLDADSHTVLVGRPDHATLRLSLVRAGGRWLVADAVRR